MTDLNTDPEAALGGALLHLPAAAASNVLALITPEDVADPHLSLIVEAARQLAEDGVAPDPATVLAFVRARGTIAGADAVGRMGLLLADLYAACATPASARWYAVALLDEALRRRFRELADRVAQATDGSPLDTVVHVLDQECRAVRPVLDRRAAAAGTAPARLRAVSA